MKNTNISIAVCLLLLAASCKKSDFLNKKPSTNIVQPTTLADFQKLLDNPAVMAYTGALPQISADEYQISFASYQTGSAAERNSYIWEKDIYGGAGAVQDWDALYAQVYYSNIVLEGLKRSDSSNTDNGRFLKGWALFSRAFAFYDLTKNFCRTYDSGTAATDLGIPLRTSSAIDYYKQRSNLQESFDQILSDLSIAVTLLPDNRQTTNLNRPSKVAGYALLARIYLDMRNYTQAEHFADLSLDMYDTLIDYNTISKTSATPFSTTNSELLFSSAQVPVYGRFSNTTIGSAAKISPEMISLYSPSDLRLILYFFLAADGSYTKKRGYSGVYVFPSTGLATDELYLIKAECLARKGETKKAMDQLNLLLIKRFDNTKPFIPLTADAPTDALAKALNERKKELIFRGLRWHDLKRLNKEGANITLSRQLNGVTYTLPPNDPRYVFPIPDDEITLSGIQQNIR